MSETNGIATGTSSTAGLPLHTLSALASRASLAQRLGTLFSGDRKMHDILGYKPTLSYRDFKSRYVRQDIAHRIVKAYPEATWSQPPGVKEDDQEETQTPFEAAWERLVTRLNVYSTLERLDLLANLGQYSVLLIGLRGQAALDQPARPVRSPDDILYLTPYSEEWATIERIEGNPGLPTFGQPLMYRLNFGRANEIGKTRLPMSQGLVHASRLIHVAEDALDDEIYGLPRLEPIYDRLDDLLKVVGGAAEGWWVDARRRLVFSLRDDARITAEDEAALKDEVDEFVHDIKNFVRVQGIDVSALQGQVANPEHHFTMIIDLIAGTTGIPKRMLLGSERGELASSQDSKNWLQRVAQRQVQFAEQRILRPLIDRLLLFQALPTPAQPYTVAWENLLGLSEGEQATIAKDVATALSQYAGPGMGQAIVTPAEFRAEYLGLSPEPEGGFLDLEPGEAEEPEDDEPEEPEEPEDDEETDDDDDDEEEAHD